MIKTVHIQWGLLVCVVLAFIFFKTIHLQVSRYNLFLLLIIVSAYLIILCVWIMERRKSSLNGKK